MTGTIQKSPNPFSGKSTHDFSPREVAKRMEKIFTNPDLNVAFAATSKPSIKEQPQPFLGGVNSIG